MSDKATRKKNKKRMAELVDKFQKIGVTVCPMDLMSVYIPKHFTSENINDWLISVRNVWHGRNSDETIIENFHDAYDKAIKAILEASKKIEVTDPKQL